MNWNLFSTVGYLGLALGGTAVLAWLVYAAAQQRWLCRLGLLLAVASLACAWANSATHMSRIAIDPAIQRAQVEAQKQARRQAALASRGEEVAQIQFAEDAEGDFLDRAGMDEADLKYMDTLKDDLPAWKRERKQRSTSATTDDSLEALIDDEEQEGGADVSELEATSAPEPILVSEEEAVLARRLDRWNLRLGWTLAGLGVLVLGRDYLRRFNLYRQASFPLPLPSALPNAVTRLPTVVERPTPPRRSTPSELAWILRRGDAFLYLTDDTRKANEAVAQLEPFTKKHRPREVLRIHEDATDDRMDDDFVFEALWFKRASFVVDSPARVEALLRRITERLQERHATRARVRQTVHLVWDLAKPMPSTLRDPLANFAAPTGFSLFLVNASDPLFARREA